MIKKQKLDSLSLQKARNLQKAKETLVLGKNGFRDGLYVSQLRKKIQDGLNQKGNRLVLQNWLKRLQEAKLDRIARISDQIKKVKQQRAKITEQFENLQQQRDNLQLQYVRLKLQGEDFEIIHKTSQYKNIYPNQTIQQNEKIGLKLYQMRNADFCSLDLHQIRQKDILELQAALRLRIKQANKMKENLEAQIKQLQTKKKQLSYLKKESLSNQIQQQELKQRYFQLQQLCNKIYEQKKKTRLQYVSHISIGYSSIFIESNGWI